MGIIFVVTIGLIVGIFLNVVIYEIKKEEKIKNYIYMDITKLKELFKKEWINNIEKITIRYFIIGILNLALYLILYFKFGITLEFFKFSFLASLLIVISVIDYDTTYVYDSSIKVGVVLGGFFIALEFIIYKKCILDNILGLVIGFITIFLIVTTTQGMGKGDCEIAAISGLFLGVKGSFLTLLISILLGGIAACVLIIWKKVNLKAEISFGPFIALATMISLVWKEEILEIYLLVM